MNATEHNASPTSSEADGAVPFRTRALGAALRIIFVVFLVAILLKVSLPQSERLWTIYDTPRDVIRLVLGLAACLFIAAQLFFFRLPKDSRGYQIWIYFGL